MILNWDEILNIRDELYAAIVKGKTKQEIKEIGKRWFKETKKFMLKRYIWFQKVLFVEWFRTPEDARDKWNINYDWIYWQFRIIFNTVSLDKGFGNDKKLNIIKEIGKRIVAYQVKIKYILQEQFTHRLKKRKLLSPMEHFMYQNERSKKDWEECANRILNEEEIGWETNRSIDYDEEPEIDEPNNTQWLKYVENDIRYLLTVIKSLK
jgi:hypothetical protein